MVQPLDLGINLEVTAGIMTLITTHAHVDPLDMLVYVSFFCGRVATSMHWTRMRFDIGVNANVMSFDISLECGGKITLITFVLVCSSVVHLDMNAKLAIG